MFVVLWCVVVGVNVGFIIFILAESKPLIFMALEVWITREQYKRYWYWNNPMLTYCYML